MCHFIESLRTWNRKEVASDLVGGGPVCLFLHREDITGTCEGALGSGGPLGQVTQLQTVSGGLECRRFVEKVLAAKASEAAGSKQAGREGAKEVVISAMARGPGGPCLTCPHARATLPTPGTGADGFPFC